MGAEKLFAAEKQGRKIAVEVKSFVSASPVHDLEEAVGQYIVYEYLLERSEPERSYIWQFVQKFMHKFFLNLSGRFC